MAKSCLIVLTGKYPYATGEQFLESEMEYHTRCFDRVLVLASDLSARDRRTRSLPEGVEAFNVSASSNLTLTRAGDVFRGAAHLLGGGASGEDRDETSRSLSKKAFREYFEARSQRQFGELCTVIDGIDLSGYGRIVIYSYWFFVMARMGVLLKGRLREKYPRADVSLYSRAHGYDVYDYVNALNYLPLRHLLLRETDMVFPCSENGSNYLRAKFPEYASKIKTFHLGSVDMGVASASGDGVFRIVSCSRLVKLKRVEEIIFAFEKLRDSGLSLMWTHMGSGAEQKQIEKLAAARLGFMEYELMGEVENSEVFNFYSNNPVDLFVNVSTNEGLPVSIMEAASFGIPAVATDVGGTGEIVLDGVTGTLISKDFSSLQLADIIRGYAQMPAEEYSGLRTAVRNMWKTNYNAADNYAVFSKEICSGVRMRLAATEQT